MFESYCWGLAALLCHPAQREVARRAGLPFEVLEARKCGRYSERVAERCACAPLRAWEEIAWLVVRWELSVGPS